MIEEKIKEKEERMKEEFEETEEIKFLMSMPGIGFILAVVIFTEIGDITRFNSPVKLAGYSGVVPRVHSSGDKTRFGKLRSDSNRYLKWAYIEAGNAICKSRKYRPYSHVSRLYERICKRRGHSKAVGAVGRHLAEATYWMLTKKENYNRPITPEVSMKQI